MAQTLEDILVSTGVLTEEQCAKAQKASLQSKSSFAEAVVKLGLASDEDVAKGVARLHNIPYASRDNKILRAERGQKLEILVSETYARDNLVLPLFIDDTVLAVALADPANVLVLDNLKVMTGLEINKFVATKTQLLKSIDEFYQAGNGLIEKTMEGPADAAAQDEAPEPEAADARVDLDKEISTQGAQVVNLVNAILKQAAQERASDIHVESYDERVMLRFRIDGVLYERMPPPKKYFMALVSRLKILSKLDIAEKRLPQDGTFSIKVQNRVIDLRISTCPTVYGEKVVMRLLDKGAVELNIDKVGFEPEQREDFLKASQFPHGLIFLTGPTGSGKTTTLNTVLNTIKTPELNFMTIEDPVEIKIEGINQVQVKADIGLTFAAALRSFLRQDPDVILVGEVRDQETAQTCLRAALTGHLVLSTLHTNDAMSTVVRLIDLGIEPFLLSGSLVLAAAQRLVRILCPACKKPYTPDAAERDMCLKESMLPPERMPDPAKVVFYEARGCEKCARTGFAGRKAIYEIYPISAEMREIIYKYGGDLTRLKECAHREGKWSMRSSGWRKVIQGLTTTKEVMSITLTE